VNNNTAGTSIPRPQHVLHISSPSMNDFAFRPVTVACLLNADNLVRRCRIAAERRESVIPRGNRVSNRQNPPRRRLRNAGPQSFTSLAIKRKIAQAIEDNRSTFVYQNARRRAAADRVNIRAANCGSQCRTIVPNRSRPWLSNAESHKRLGTIALHLFPVQFTGWLFQAEGTSALVHSPSMQRHAAFGFLSCSRAGSRPGRTLS